MENSQWAFPHKPYDLRDRLFIYACVIVRLVQFLHTQGSIAKWMSHQILGSGTSAGANYEEADGGSSHRDKQAKRKIALRELMETHFRLRVLRKTGLLHAIHEPVIDETDELVRILATIIRNAEPADDHR
jgi:four helix bundle protein